MFFDKYENRCSTCGYRDTCEIADNTLFCEDCAQYNICTIHNVVCEAGHEIECNNDFTVKCDIEED